WNAWSSSSALRRALFRDAGCESRLVAPGGIPMNNPFARHLVDERDRVLQRVARAGQIVLVDGRADALERGPEPRAEAPVVFAVIETLSMRLERRCVRCHVISNLQNL